MIRRTLQLVPGVGPWREKDLWARGAHGWDTVHPEPLDDARGRLREAESRDPWISTSIDAELCERIDQARAALSAKDLAALAKLVPPREHWRLYPAFVDQAVFFDIECGGGDDPRPTVVTTMSPDGLRAFIEGRNLEALPEALGRWPLWVTFNGTVFDVPVLRRHFGSALGAPALHLDLRFFFRKLGRSAGLKALEEELQLGRPPHLRSLHGLHAADLWRQHRESGELGPLRLLVEYNAYDAINLRAVMDRGYNRAVERLHLDDERIAEFERGDVLYDLSQLLLSLHPTEEDRRAQARAAPQDRQLVEGA